MSDESRKPPAKDAPLVIRRGQDGKPVVEEGVYKTEILPDGNLKIDPKNVGPKSGGSIIGEPFGPDVISGGTLTTGGETISNN